MVEFWGIFVVFSACTAFQLTESRHHNAPDVLDASVSDTSNDWSDLPRYLFDKSLESNSLDSSEVGDNDLQRELEHSRDKTEITVATTTLAPKRSKATSKKRLSLNQRRLRLFVFARDGMREYEKDFVRLSREAIRNIVLELEALPRKSHNVKEKIIVVKQALKEIKDVDVDEESTEFDAIGEATNIVGDLNDELDSTVDAPPELVQVLEKIGWMEMRHNLGEEMRSLINGFGKEFNIFIETLTPLERLMEAGLVELNKRFSKGNIDTKWNSFTEFWTYFAF